MPVIYLELHIKAPIDRCFDLARSVDMHIHSTQHTNETAIAGKTSGLLELDEQVTWRARHLGVMQTLTSRITAMQRPHSFTDEMIEGAFHSFKHEHLFEQVGDTTIMTDNFIYQSPLGLLGKLVDTIFLKNYMTRLLTTRNLLIKEYAETEKWKEVLEVR